MDLLGVANLLLNTSGLVYRVNRLSVFIALFSREISITTTEVTVRSREFPAGVLD